MKDLEYEEFKKYEVNPDLIGYFKTGKYDHKFIFENGYGASVMKHPGSYGYKNDLFELAVLHKDSREWNLCYETYITDDVRRFLTNEEVLKLLNEIKELDVDEEKNTYKAIYKKTVFIIKNITRELLSRTEKLKELGEENTSLKAQNDKLNEFLLLLDKQWQEKYENLLKEHTEFYNYIDSNGMEE